MTITIPDEALETPEIFRAWWNELNQEQNLDPEEVFEALRARGFTIEEKKMPDTDKAKEVRLHIIKPPEVEDE